MTRKAHMQHTTKFGPTCQGGKVGGSLRGEHVTMEFSEFAKLDEDKRCSRCTASPLFSFLQRKAEAESAAQWEPEEPDAWKKSDDALLAAKSPNSRHDPVGFARWLKHA